MNFTYSDWLVHLEHHKELLKEAEQNRLAKQVKSPKHFSKQQAPEPVGRRHTEPGCCLCGAGAA